MRWATASPDADANGALKGALGLHQRPRAPQELEQTHPNAEWVFFPRAFLQVALDLSAAERAAYLRVGSAYEAQVGKLRARKQQALQLIREVRGASQGRARWAGGTAQTGLGSLPSGGRGAGRS